MGFSRFYELALTVMKEKNKLYLSKFMQHGGYTDLNAGGFTHFTNKQKSQN